MATPLPSLSGLPLAEALRVEQLCTRFEGAWKQGPAQPRLEDFLPGEGGNSEDLHVMLCELLQVELAYRCQRGDLPALAEYLARFPSQKNIVARVFAEAGMGADQPKAQEPTTIAEPLGAAAAAAPSGEDRASLEVPGYEILATLGRGGMGTIFKARQLSANRTVALKVIRADRLQGVENDEERRKWIGRFHWEAEAVANLDHPHIVPLYDVGEHAGQPFFSMKLVEGGSLYGTAGRFGRNVRAAAELVAKVARALHHAHQRQILHRDLKPHNILLDSEGQPLVTDFGLACRIEPAETRGKVTEGIMGTPEYMAPEQVRAERLTTSVDVYGLGAVLYYMLTGHPPHQGRSKSQIIADVLEKEPPRPRTLNKRVDRDLETICLKCLRMDPGQRYGSAQEVAEELERWLRGETIRARWASPVVRLQKWVRRRPALAAALLGTLLAVLTAGYFAYHDHLRSAELLQQRIDNAIATALRGDPEQTEKAIRRAELQGASTGQVRLLRGLVSFQRSDVKPAIDELEQAAQLVPDSVAVRALLAIFHFRAGHWAKHDQRMNEVAVMQAKNPEDFLFKGYQQSFYDTKIALETLNAAVELRDTGVARAMRAEVQARYALDWTDAGMAAKAQEDALVAKGQLSGNPFVMLASLQAHLAAAILHGENGEQGHRAFALDKAKDDVKALQDYYAYPWVRTHCAQYFEQAGKPKEASDALRLTTPDEFNNSPAVFDYAADLYRHGRIKQALEILDQRHKETDDSEGDRLKACLLAELDGKADGLEAIGKEKGWLKKYPDRGNIGDAVIVLLLLGSKAEAQRVAKSIEFRDWPMGNVQQEYNKRYKEYASGATPEALEALLAAAKPLRSCRCSAHFLIGMTRLADGDRSGAKEHLGAAVDSQDYFNNDYTLSRVFLARMKANETWPPWIPVKK
jgi:tetratricopeptide (TPR) repeat protein